MRSKVIIGSGKKMVIVLARNQQRGLGYFIIDDAVSLKFYLGIHTVPRVPC